MVPYAIRFLFCVIALLVNLRAKRSLSIPYKRAILVFHIRTSGGSTNHLDFTGQNTKIDFPEERRADIRKTVYLSFSGISTLPMHFHFYVISRYVIQSIFFSFPFWVDVVCVVVNATTHNNNSQRYAKY